MKNKKAIKLYIHRLYLNKMYNKEYYWTLEVRLYGVILTKELTESMKVKKGYKLHIHKVEQRIGVAFK